MAESRTVTVVPLSGSNYASWKVQCLMALTKDGLWNIFNGYECPPDPTPADRQANFVARTEHALPIIVLSVELSLLYLIGHPEDLGTVGQKLTDQFQKKTRANTLEL